MVITENNNNQNQNKKHCVFSQREKCRIYDQYSGEKLPLHLIPGTDHLYVCEDHYLADKINKWWQKHPKPENKPQFQEHPKCRVRAYPYFHFSHIPQESIPFLP